MKIIVACEYSGTVRRAFAEKGNEVFSCDLLPSDDNSKNHFICDIKEIINYNWDLMIAHPPCTDIAVSGAAHFAKKIANGKQQAALDFVRFLMDSAIPMIAIENPVSVISTKIRKPDQIIHPWMFGHPEQKTTCLWLKNLPPLKETNNVKAEMLKLPKNERERIHYLGPSKDRWKIRSKTFPGIAEAMADQWGMHNG